MAKRVYEHCPACGRKGFYLSNGYPFWGNGTKCCRYCGHAAVKPFIPKPAASDELKSPGERPVTREEGPGV